jgi:3-hydroxy-3-methylglutaryl CoA synthase
MLKCAKYLKNCSYKTSNLSRIQGAPYINFHTPNIKMSQKNYEVLLEQPMG